ncbi:MAG: methyltransferase domain-containing protein [Bacillota bacterium]|nr:methyltransferase domain-containing protein [Bacillota bacterium]MDW7682903.1 methyltransferase domain-containing protein [Bacillota bacterium]
MTEYGGLAEIYDTLMLGVDYGEWAEYIESLVRRHGGVPQKTVLDVACGTGSTTLAMARAGYIATGLDLSGEMLSVARQKASRERLDINFMRADMRSFSLPESVGLVVSFQDGLNYLPTTADFEDTMKAVAACLERDGLFIFDINRVEKLHKSKTTDVFWVDSEEFTLIWETRFISNDMWEINITGFVPTENGLYRKFSEVHRERMISEEEVVTALEKAGLKLTGRYAAFSQEEPDESSRRTFYVARNLQIKVKPKNEEIFHRR